MTGFRMADEAGNIEMGIGVDRRTVVHVRDGSTVAEVLSRLHKKGLTIGVSVWAYIKSEDGDGGMEQVGHAVVKGPVEFQPLPEASQEK